MTVFSARAAAAAVLALVAGVAAAQQPSFPTQPIRLVTGYPAGVGAVDVLVRQIAAYMKTVANVPVLVENRTGAMTNIAAEYVAKSKADGHTLFITAGNSTFAANVHIFRKLPFDPVKGFAPVTTLTTLPFVLMVSPTANVGSVEELSRLLRQKQAKGGYATSTPLTVVMSELYKSIAGLETLQVPYRSLEPAWPELAAGGIDFLFVDSANARIVMQQKRARGLAVTSGQRSPSIPDMPTMVEAGVPGFDITSWQAVWAPAGTPRPVIDRLSAWFNQSLASEDVKKVMAQTWQDPFPGSPESLARLQAAEMEKWERLVKAAKIEPQ
jgi:tripartite-type tricarboxylate transporter receptor subunit TctC